MLLFSWPKASWRLVHGGKWSGLDVREIGALDETYGDDGTSFLLNRNIAVDGQSSSDVWGCPEESKRNARSMWRLHVSEMQAARLKGALWQQEMMIKPTEIIGSTQVVLSHWHTAFLE
jgi:hypothetical protein